MSNLPVNAIQIPRPAPKSVSEVQVPPKAYLNFQFSLQGASSAKQGDDLVVEMPDGSKVVCLGYYSNNAEGDRPQIAVNGEALPPSALDLSFFTHEVEGVRLAGQPGSKEGNEAGQEAGQDGKQAGADAKAPASSGATATGESAASTDGGAGQQAGQQAGQGSASQGSASGQGQASQTGQGSDASSATSSASSSSSGSASGALNDGGLKQDLNVDFLSGINRLPGLDLGSNRGFENTDIAGSPTGGNTGGIWGGIIGENGSTTAPAPETPPFIPTDPAPPAPPAPPVVDMDVAGLREQGFDADKNPVGHDPADATVSHSLTVTLPADMDASFVKLNVTLPNGTLVELAPGADFSATYGDFSYTVSDKLDASGNPFSPPQVEITLTYKNLDNDHADINGLQLGESVKDSLHYEVTVDGDAGTSGKGNVVQTGDVNIAIEGSNDGPVLKPVGDPSAGLVGQGEVKEEGVFSDNRKTGEGAWDSYDPDTDADQPDFGTHKNETHIQLGVNDADTNDSHTYTLTQPDSPSVSIAGLHAGATAALVKNADGSYTLTINGEACGTLTLSPTGEMVFTLNSDASAIQGMKAGEASTVTVNVTVTDRGGLSNSGDVSLTIHGTNDRPSLEVVKNADDTHITLTEKGADVAIEESGDLNGFGSVSGSVLGADSDTGDSFSYHLVSKGTSVDGKDKLDAGDTVAETTAPDGSKIAEIVGDYGTLVLHPDGTYTYTENGSLKGGESKSESFTVLVKDANGAFSTKELTFEVTGKYYDVTVGNQPPSVTVTEDGVQDGSNKPEAGSPGVRGDVTVDSSGNPTFTDNGLDGDVVFSYKLAVQPGTDATITEDSAAGTQTLTTQYGTLVFNMADGTYTYTLNAGANKLGINDSLTEHFTVKIYKDGSLVDSELQLDVNIQGTNDKPTLTVTTEGGVTVDVATGNGFASLVESGQSDAPNKIQGSLSSDDVDTGDKAGLTYHVVVKGASLTDPDVLQDGYLDADGVVEGDWGTLTLNADGTFTYAENGKLTSGQPGSDTFTVLVKDAHGAFTTKELTFNVRGSYNDVVFTDATHDVTVIEPGVGPGNKPVVGEATASGNILEDSSGNPTFTDSDGSVVTRVYTLESTDPDATSSIDSVTGKQTITTTYGTLVFDTATGEYTYTITDPNHPDIHKLPKNAFLTESFTLQVTKDGNTVGSNLTVEVKIQGTNDMPTIKVVDTGGGVTVNASGDGEASLVETGRNAELDKTPGSTDTHNSVSGKLEAGDADQGPGVSHTFHIVNKNVNLAGQDVLKPPDLDSDGILDGDWGTLKLNADGTFTYTENGKVKANQTKDDTFTVLVKDEHGAFVTKELTFHVTGKENTLEVALDNYVINLVEEGVTANSNTDTPGTPTKSGNIRTLGDKANIIDDDDDPSLWSYDLAIKGSESWPKTTGTDAKGAYVSYDTPYGMLIFYTTSGDYTYELDNAAAHSLGYGNNKTETFVVTITKGSQTINQDFTVTIKGTNDRPDLTLTMTNLSVTEDAAPNEVSGKATATDVDVHADGTKDTLSFDIMSGSSALKVVDGEYGILRIDENGVYTYTLDNNRKTTQQLGVGETRVEKFTIRVTDEFGAYTEQEITVTVTGALDNPALLCQRGTVYEDGGTGDVPDFDTSGKVSVSTTDAVHKNGPESFTIIADAAAGQTASTPDADGLMTVTTKYGELRFNTLTGEYTYELSAAANALLALQAKNIDEIFAEESFKVQASFKNANGSTTTVDTKLTVDIKGINDAPEFVDAGSNFTNSIDRTHPLDAAPSKEGTVVAKDVDNTSLAESGAGKPSQLLFSFKVVVGQDANGNDIYEYVQNIETEFGRVSIDAVSGKYTYHLDNLNATIKGLGLGQVEHDSFKVWVRDPHGAEDSHDITITINGKDFTGGASDSHELPNLELVVKEDSALGKTDRPDADTVNPGQEDASGSGSAITPSPNPVVRYCFKTTDKDGKVVMSQSMKGDYGDIYIDAYTGEYRYVLNNHHSMVQALAAGAVVWDKFAVYTFTYKDGNIQWLDAANAKGTITVKVEGANDAPELEHLDVAQGLNIFAGATNITTSGSFAAHDVDRETTPDVLTFSLGASDVITGTTNELIITNYGKVTIDQNGKYTFLWDPAQPFTGSTTISFWVFVDDGHGGTDKEKVDIVVTAANARPVIVSCTFTAGFEGLEHDFAYGVENPAFIVDPISGEITLGGKPLEDGETLNGAMLESTTNLKGSFTSWDHEVVNAGQTPNYKYYLCDANGENLKSILSDQYGTLEMKSDGSFVYTLNNNNLPVQQLTEGQKLPLSYYVVVRDAKGDLSDPQHFEITIVRTNNKPVITIGNDMTMTEWDTSTAVSNITIKDPDLNDAVTHDFDVKVAQGSTNLTVKETQGTADNGGDLYTFAVMKDGSTAYGKLFIQVDPTDATKATYWFELNHDAVDYLTPGQNITLKFSILFNDGQNLNNLSNEASFNLSIQGATKSGTFSLSLVDDASDTVVDATHTDAPAPLLAAAATELLSDQVGSLGSPDSTLPGDAPAPLVGQGGSSTGTGPTAHAGAATESGPAQPITLETPLNHAPLPDMTSAPGQEALQFQLQTTGV